MKRATDLDDHEMSTLADNYLTRIRSFQDSLITWGVTWNIALIGASFVKFDSINDNFKNLLPYLPLWIAFYLNFILALLYSNGRIISKALVKGYKLPEACAQIYIKNIRLLLVTWLCLQGMIIFLLKVCDLKKCLLLVALLLFSLWIVFRSRLSGSKDANTTTRCNCLPQ